MFWAPCSSGQVAGGWGGCLEASGGMKGVPTHVHMHMHMHTCTCIHVYKLQMATNMEASMFIMFNMHVGVCMHVCVFMEQPPHTHTHLQPNPPTCHPQGGPLESVKIQ